MKAEEVSAALAVGAGIWLLLLAVLTGCWVAGLLILPAMALAFGVTYGEG